MDGGVADTTCYYTGRAAGAVQHNAHALRTPKHGGRYRNGRRRGLGWVDTRIPQGLSERPVASRAPVARAHIDIPRPGPRRHARGQGERPWANMHLNNT